MTSSKEPDGRPRRRRPADRTPPPASGTPRVDSSGTPNSDSHAQPAGRGRATHPASHVDSDGRRSSYRRLVALGVIAVVVSGLLVWQRLTRPDVDRLLADARRDWTANASAADDHLERAIQAAGGSLPVGHVLRCRLRVELQRPADALAYLDAFAAEMAADPAGLVELALTAEQMEQPAVAARAARLVPVSAPTRMAALRIAVSSQRSLGQFEQALEGLQEWSAAAPRDPEPRLEAARTLRQQARLMPAIAECRAAVQLAEARLTSIEPTPGMPASVASARRELVELLVTARDAAAARETFDQLAAVATDRAALALVEGYLLRLEGRLEEALDRVELACQRQPAGVEPRFLRGVVLSDAARFADAADQLKEVVRLDPHHKEAHYKLAQALQRTGQANEARQHLETSARLTKLAEERLALQQRLADEPAPATFRRLAEISQALGLEREAAYWRAQATVK